MMRGSSVLYFRTGGMDFLFPFLPLEGLDDAVLWPGLAWFGSIGMLRGLKSALFDSRFNLVKSQSSIDKSLTWRAISGDIEPRTFPLESRPGPARPVDSSKSTTALP